MQILAFDPGKTTGYAYTAEDGVASGSFTFDQHDHGERLYRFRLWAQAFIQYEPELVVWDQPFARGAEGAANVAMGKYLEEICWDHDVKRLIAPMNSVKKAVLGNGRATDKDIFNWAREQGHDPKTVHEADALVLLAYGMTQ